MLRNNFIFFCCLTMVCFGCSNAPNGFPKVVPCVVVVTDNGLPIADVFVSIQTVPPTESLSVIAYTDAQGKATMQTVLGTYAKTGIPAGKIVMVLDKSPDIPHTKSETERNNMSPAEGLAYMAKIETEYLKLPNSIPPPLRTANISPLTKDTSSEDVSVWHVKLEEYKK
ncbi:MAG: hypothetical protein LBK82_16350 [Planctomycetaceae bacterium]|nr:hypothetical protein [Planctomycetaceae bacterium]